MEQIFFNGWDSLIRTFVVGALAYVTLIFFLRISGKKTLSKMNAFDLVVTVALGSTLATALLTKDVTLADGALAFALLIGLQFIVSWSSIRMDWLRRLVTGEPHIVLYQGEFLLGVMHKLRVTKEEVCAAIRSAGLASLDDVKAVVLETDGSFSVIYQGQEKQNSSFAGVNGLQQKQDVS